MIECTSEFRSLDPDEPTNPVDRLVTENENLRRKLQTLPVIEQAKGILMGRYGIPADDAFEMLRRWSQHTNTKLPASTPTAHPQGRETSASDGHSWLSPHPAAATDTKEQLASHPWAPCRTSNR